MHIALFGGSFDPPHKGHLKIIQAVLDQNLFDEVWFLPVFEHQARFDKETMSSWRDRLAMLSLVQTAQTRIEKFEKDSGKQSYTHLALRKLSEKYSEHTFSWLMGSDQLASLTYWKCNLHEQCFPACADEFNYYVYPRVGFDLQLPYNNLKLIEHVQPMNISSTQIRDLVKKGEAISGLVSNDVESYIYDKHLYKK